MKTKKLSIIKTAIAAAASAATSLIGAGIAAADEPAIKIGPVPQAVRLRDEHTRNLVTDIDSNKATLGVAGDNGEFLRVYNFLGDGKGNDYTAMGFAPWIKFGGLEASVNMFGVAGGKEGIGTETKFSIKPCTLFLNYEESMIKGDNPTRIGGALDTKIENTTFGFGFDQTNSPVIRNALNFKVFSDVTGNDQLGAAYNRIDNPEMNSVAAYWLHHNKDNAKWGTRTWGKFDWSNESDCKALTLDSIWAQNPTMPSVCGDFIVDRGSLNGGMYNRGVVMNPLQVERFPLIARTKNGFAGEIKFFATDKAGILTSSVFGELAYRFPLPEIFEQKTLLGFSISDQYSLEPRQNVVGGSMLLDVGNFRLEVSGRTGTSGNKKEEIYGSVGYAFKW
ncbi:hypothetical protein HYW76_00965 [Candidatus Pacearchaeota archaeon]|nr:hypothetical protein [Candidatus Pacearchaeota archaeon]